MSRLRSHQILLLLLLPVGCGGGDAAPSQTAGMEHSSAVEAPAPTHSTTPQIRGDTVEVQMSEYMFALPTRTLPAGRLVFELHNIGHEWHNFVITKGDSLVFLLDLDVDPEETVHVELNLEAGEYQVICSLAGHDAKGMTESLTIVAAGAP